MTAPSAVISAELLLVELQLVGAHGAEGERVEDQHGRLALQVLLGEALAAFGGEREARNLGAGVEDAHSRYLRRPSSLISAR